MSFQHPLVILAACSMVACSAHVQAGAGAQVNGNGPDDHQWETQPESWQAAPGERPAPPKSSTGDAADATPPTDEPPLFVGVVHDLSLSSQVENASCSCLSVVAGAPSGNAFTWGRGAPPKTSADTLAIALRKLPSCTGVAPSVAGVEYEGGDLVLLVEPARAGRPSPQGVLAKRPPAGGSVVVRPKGLRYGGSLSGSGACKLALP